MKPAPDVKTGMYWICRVDRTLGGGIVPEVGHSLWRGEPGIGKSTLILQLCHAVSKKGQKALYCTGRVEADKMRADRLHMGEDECFILADGNPGPHGGNRGKTGTPDFVVYRFYSDHVCAGK